MSYSERDMVKRTARAVLDALPSSYMPDKVPYEEAIAIGKRLMPEWLLMKVLNPDDSSNIDVMLEFSGRGILFAAIGTLPRWLQNVWASKEDMENEDELLEFVTTIIYHIPDAEKIASHWVELACGWSIDDVMEKIITSNREVVEKESESIEETLSSLEEM